MFTLVHCAEVTNGCLDFEADNVSAQVYDVSQTFGVLCFAYCSLTTSSLERILSANDGVR